MVNIGKGIENTRIVMMNPNTPIKFFSALSWIASKFFDEISNRITAEDQQIAVIIAYISPKRTMRQFGD